MAAVGGCIQYDQVTGQDLFDSFMDIALTEAGDIHNDVQLKLTTPNNNRPSNSENVKFKGSSSPNIENKVSQPLRVKLHEPVHETCGDDRSMKVKYVNKNNSVNNEKTSSAVEAIYAVVDKTMLGRERKIVNIVKEVKVMVKENSVGKISAVEVDNKAGEKSIPKTKKEMLKSDIIEVSASPISKNNDYGNIKIQQNKTLLAEQNTRYDDVAVAKFDASSSKRNVTDLYAVVDKSRNNAEKTIYADVTVFSSNNDNIIQPENEYTNVMIKSPTSATNADYETISGYQCNLGQIKYEETKVDVKNEDTFPDRKQVATTGRLLTEGQSKLYKNIANTIDRGNKQLSQKSTSGQEKRNIFNRASKKYHSEDGISSDIQPNSRRWSALDGYKYMDGKTGRQSSIKRQSSIPILCSGELHKQGGTGLTPKNWRRRWFELKKDNCLYYYKSEQDEIPSGAIILLKYNVARAAEVNKKFAFKLMKGGARTYFFAANSEEEMRKWMKNLSEAAREAVSDHTSIPECSLKNVSIPALSITEPDCHGFLWKQGNSHKSWKKRYCVLKYGCVFYYEDMSNEVAIGVFKLHNHIMKLNENVKYGFQAEPPLRKMRTYQFYAENEMDFNRWFEAMKHSIATFH